MTPSESACIVTCTKPMKSILRLVALSFILLLLFLGISLSVFFVLGTLQDHAHQAFLNKNEDVLTLSRTVSQLNVLSSTMLRSSSTELIPDYRNAMALLDQQIEQVRLIPEVDAELDAILRRLAYFNDYQRILLNDSSLIPFETFTYIRDSVIQHQMAVDELVLGIYRLSSETFSAYENRLGTIEYSFWLLLITSIFMIVLTGTRYARRIGLQIKQIQHAAHRLSERDWATADIPSSGFLELDELATGMNKMKREILLSIQKLHAQAEKEKELGEKLIQSEKRDKLLMQAQLSALRAQINPHFLFNALDIIGKVAFLNNPELAMELIEAISKILRYSLDATDQLVPLSEELSIIQDYLLLQKVRFGERVVIEYAVAEEARQARMPAMLLQPILENCFKHGMKAQASLHIRLEADLEQDILKVVVHDTGEGFETGEIVAAPSPHIGLNNVSSRLSLRYKRDDLFSIVSKKHAFTTVTLRIPQQEEPA